VNLKYQIGINNYNLFRREVTDIGSRAAAGLGQIIEDNYRTSEVESNFLVTFAHAIGEDITVKAILGHNVNQQESDRQEYSGKEMIAPGIYDIDNTKSVVASGGGHMKRRLWALFADFSFSYKNWLFLNVTGRNDWSSTLEESKNSYFYPALAASYVFTDAIGIKSDILSFGKLRASWAKVGNDAPAYSLYKTFLIGQPFNGQPTITTPNTSNFKDLEPEFTSESEGGFQLDFFKGRIGLDFTYYDKRSTNMIASVQVPASSGYEYKWTNVGELKNSGVEIGLNLTPVILNNGFKWNIFTSFTHNKSEVKSLMEGVERLVVEDLSLDDMQPVLEPGKAYGVFRGTRPLIDSATNALVIDPLTGFPYLDKEVGIIGDPNPDYKLGITNTFSYKNLSLSILWDCTHGGDVYSVTLNSLMGRGVTKDTEDREHALIIPGYYGDGDGNLYYDNNGNPIPNQTLMSTNDMYFYGGGPETSFALNAAGYYLIYDATVYRLREVTLSYDLPKSWFGKIPIGSATLSLTGRNLWYFAPNVPEYTNFDPEVNGFGTSNVQGVDLSCAPSVRRYGINLKVTF
jgi:hypothetical protein